MKARRIFYLVMAFAIVAAVFAVGSPAQPAEAFLSVYHKYATKSALDRVGGFDSRVNHQLQATIALQKKIWALAYNAAYASGV